MDLSDYRNGLACVAPSSPLLSKPEASWNSNLGRPARSWSRLRRFSKMNLAAVEKIAKSVLYEGYFLYPYRPSPVENRQRWNFGVLTPPSWAEIRRGAESSMSQTQCLVRNSVLPAVEVRVRFLHLIARSIGRLKKPLANWPGEGPGQIAFETVEGLEFNGRNFRPWQEVEEREVSLRIQYGDTVDLRPVQRDFTILGARRMDPIRQADGRTAGVIVREREGLSPDR